MDTKRIYRREMCEKGRKMCRKVSKNAYIVAKRVKKGRKKCKKRIYSSKSGQKSAKNEQKNRPKRIYRGNFAHFLRK